MASAAGAKKSAFVPERSDIVWIQHDPQAGKEMKGMHPMLIISTKAFVERTGLVIGFPMTHAGFNSDNPFAVAVQGPKKRWAMCCATNPSHSTGRPVVAGNIRGKLRQKMF